MKYPWIDAYLMAKPGVEKDVQSDWNWIRYKIGSMMFCAVCLDDQDQPYYITLKLEPAKGDALRQLYPDILPVYYMNKVHWNSVRPDGTVPEELMKEMLDESYHLVLHRLSRKIQKKILEEIS